MHASGAAMVEAAAGSMSEQPAFKPVRGEV
jgi:hypothetical protein